MCTQSAERPTQSTAVPKKISVAGLIVRLTLFVFSLSLPFLVARTLAWLQGLMYLSLMLFLVAGSRIIIARKWPNLVRERVRGGELADGGALEYGSCQSALGMIYRRNSLRDCHGGILCAAPRSDARLAAESNDYLSRSSLNACRAGRVGAKTKFVLPIMKGEIP